MNNLNVCQPTLGDWQVDHLRHTERDIRTVKDAMTDICHDPSLLKDYLPICFISRCFPITSPTVRGASPVE